MLLFVYFAVTFAALVALGAMILAIAKSLAQCPETGRAARAAGLTIATGFLAIGGGVVLLIATLPMIEPSAGTVLFAMGLACLMLGLGFTQAITTLRVVVQPERPKAVVPMEPVLA